MNNKLISSRIQLVAGKHKAFNPRMVWTIMDNNGRVWTLSRTQGLGANVNSSAFAQKHIVWKLQSPDDQNIYIPDHVRRHEVSIARWMLTSKQDIRFPSVIM